MNTVLTIAGSDSGGGAGIQADIKTMSAHGIYAMSAITALTAQNTMGVTDIMEVTPEFLGKELDAIFTDIYPDAVKLGMLSDVHLMQVTTAKLREYKAKHVVIDPVMVATSGSRLMKEDAIQFMKDELFPLAEIITPNIPEAECLTKMTISGEQDMVDAGIALYLQVKERKQYLSGEPVNTDIFNEQETAILVKGGHRINDANDILVIKDRVITIRAERIDNVNTHGTGCTLSSAIACNLAMEKTIEEAVRSAKEYLTGAIRSGLNLGKGPGPLNHMWQDR